MNEQETVFVLNHLILKAVRIYYHNPSSEELQQFIDYCKEKYPKYDWCIMPTEAKRSKYLYYVSCYAL